MKTQVSILFKGDTFGSSFLRSSIIKIFKKPQIAVSIDGQPTNTLKASKEAYIFEVAPGQHRVEILDLNAKSKASERRFLGSFIGFFIGLGTGSLSNGALLGKASGDLMEGKTIDQNNINIFLNDGDLIKISVKTAYNGSCKIKILQ